MTWEGVVTKYHKEYKKEIGLNRRIEAYVQSRVLKMTLESLTLESRRGSYSWEHEDLGTRENTTEAEYASRYFFLSVSKGKQRQTNCILIINLVSNLFFSWWNDSYKNSVFYTSIENKFFHNFKYKDLCFAGKIMDMFFVNLPILASILTPQWDSTFSQVFYLYKNQVDTKRAIFLIIMVISVKILHETDKKIVQINL